MAARISAWSRDDMDMSCVINIQDTKHRSNTFMTFKIIKCLASNLKYISNIARFKGMNKSKSYILANSVILWEKV